MTRQVKVNKREEKKRPTARNNFDLKGFVGALILLALHGGGGSRWDRGRPYLPIMRMSQY